VNTFVGLPLERLDDDRLRRGKVIFVEVMLEGPHNDEHNIYVIAL
jgi:hypothetical protein